MGRHVRFGHGLVLGVAAGIVIGQALIIVPSVLDYLNRRG